MLFLFFFSMEDPIFESLLQEIMFVRDFIEVLNARGSADLYDVSRELKLPRYEILSPSRNYLLREGVIRVDLPSRAILDVEDPYIPYTLFM